MLFASEHNADDEPLNPQRIQRVATVKVRGGRRHLMCGRDELRTLCKSGVAKRSLKECQLTSPIEVNCWHCVSHAVRIAEEAAEAEAFDLHESGSVEILADLLLERAKRGDLFKRRLVLIYALMREQKVALHKSRRLTHERIRRIIPNFVSKEETEQHWSLSADWSPAGDL